MSKQAEPTTVAPSEHVAHTLAVAPLVVPVLALLSHISIAEPQALLAA